MITLYTFPEAFGLRNVSPFCLKVEMTLTHLGMPFEIKEMSDPRKAPKGKLPYIDLDGRIIADSEIILEELDQISQGKLLARLDPKIRATGFAFNRLADDHLYWLMVASRWLDPQWFPNVVAGFFGFVPGVIRGFAARSAQKAVGQTLNLHGLGRHTLDQQKDFARRDLTAINDIVTSQRYLVGDEITVFDFCMASLLAGLLDNQPPTWLTTIAREEYPGLIEYADRIQEEVGVYGRQ